MTVLDELKEMHQSMKACGFSRCSGVVGRAIDEIERINRRLIANENLVAEQQSQMNQIFEAMRGVIK